MRAFPVQGSVVVGCFRGAPEGGALIAGEAIVAVDVVRTTTTAVTAVAQGRRCFTAPTIAAARRRATRLERPLLAGEIAGVMPAGFDLSSSVAELAGRSDVERPLVLATSAGTPLIHAAALTGTVYLASLRNARHLGAWLAGRHERVAVVAAASRGQFGEEDRVCCAQVAGELLDAGYAAEDPDTESLVRRWRDASADVWLRCRRGQRQDVEFILGHQDDLADAYAMRAGEVVPVAAGVALPA